MALAEAARDFKRDARYFAAAPTREFAKRVYWEDLKKLTPRDWLEGEPAESDLRIRTWWGAELWVLGLDKPQRIEGSPWDGGVIDEFADCKPGAWEAHIRPALSTRGREGWCWLVGVPDRDAPGQVDYKRMYERARSGRDPNWASFHWPSAEIMSPEEVEAARHEMDDETFRQEYGGEFVLAGGLAFPTFDEQTHVKASEAVYDPSLPICWSLDFNINPMCSGILQRPAGGGPFRVLAELVLADTSTDVACDAFLDWCEQHKADPRNVRIYGDPSGSARDTTSGRSDWAIVRQRLNHLDPLIKVARSPWPIKDTLNAVRARLKNAAGEVGMVIHPSCRRLIRDFNDLLWPSDLSEGHCLAWLRYFAIWEYPIRTAMPEASGRIVTA